MKENSNKNYEIRPNGTKRVVTFYEGKTRTQQQFAEQCDVNNIIAKYRKTGSITHVRNAQAGVYADLTELPSLEEAQKVMIVAREAFEQVPAKIRNRFGHDPQQFIEFLSNPENNEEAIKLGLKIKKAEPKPDPILTELQTLNKNISTSKTKTKTTPSES